MKGPTERDRAMAALGWAPEHLERCWYWIGDELPEQAWAFGWLRAVVVGVSMVGRDYVRAAIEVRGSGLLRAAAQRSGMAPTGIRPPGWPVLQWVWLEVPLMRMYPREHPYDLERGLPADLEGG